MTGAVRSGWSLRIVGVGHKVLYVVAAVVLCALVSRVLPRVNDAFDVISGEMIILALWVVAVRSFRGSNEDVVRPRAWWRVTARPTAGFVAGGIFLILFVLSSLALLVVDPGNGTFFFDLVFDPLYLLLAVAHLYSSVRLGRAAKRSAAAPPKVRAPDPG